MQIAVAGMEHVGDPQVVFFRQFANSRQGLRQRAARNGSVHAEIVGRAPSYRRKRRLAPGPEQVAFIFRIRNLTKRRAARLRDCLHAPDQFIDLDGGTVQFDDEACLCAVEVGDVTCYRRLAAELVAGEATAAKLALQPFFARRHLL